MRPPREGAVRTPDVEEDGETPSASSAAEHKSQIADLRRDPRFHRLCQRLHGLGPRPIGELLLEVAAGRDLLEALEAYAQLAAAAVARLDRRNWPASMWAVSA